LIAQAAKTFASLPDVPLYARVDGIARDGAFVLMELELIEPNLFFGFQAGSAERLGEAVAKRLLSSRGA